MRRACGRFCKHLDGLAVMALASQSGSESALGGVVGFNQILPCQYFDLSGGHRLSGEQRLMLALLADAINVYQQGALSRSTRKRLLYIDAERWMIAEGGSRHAFSFETVCDSLGINPAVLRRRMIAWKHQVRCGLDTWPARHFRLKITPRPRHVSQRRRRARTTSLRAF
jgi:hypothetical protein